MVRAPVSVDGDGYNEKQSISCQFLFSMTCALVLALSHNSFMLGKKTLAMMIKATE
jgi:hypothetical protein